MHDPSIFSFVHQNTTVINVPPSSFLTETNFARSLLTIGGKRQFELFRTALSKNDSVISVVVLGGSITCCHPLKSVHVDACHGDIDLSWPSQLRLLLEKHFNRTIHVHNLCKAAVGSNYWVNSVTKWRSSAPNHVFFSAHIVIVEAAVNDVDNGINERCRFVGPGDGITQETEMLLRLLLLSSNKTIFLWLEASRSQKSPLNAVVSHTTALVSYSIPQLDVVRAFHPWNEEWYKNSYIVDSYGHVSTTGHRIIAYLTYLYFSSLSKTDDQNIASSPLMCGKNFTCMNSSDRPLPSPLFFDQQLSKIYETGYPLYVDYEIQRPTGLSEFEFKHILDLDGFSHYSDRLGKPGLIGLNVGSIASFRFVPDELRTHFVNKMIEIRFLRTYEHVGIANISIYVSSYTGGPFCEWYETYVTSRIFDCQWTVNKNQTSTLVSIGELVSFNLHSLDVNESAFPCLDIKVEIMKANRMQSKVKILSISVM